jgi:hypothetical protein
VALHTIHLLQELRCRARSGTVNRAGAISCRSITCCLLLLHIGQRGVPAAAATTSTRGSGEFTYTGHDTPPLYWSFLLVAAAERELAENAAPHYSATCRAARRVRVRECGVRVVVASLDYSEGRGAGRRAGRASGQVHAAAGGVGLSRRPPPRSAGASFARRPPPRRRPPPAAAAAARDYDDARACYSRLGIQPESGSRALFWIPSRNFTPAQPPTQDPEALDPDSRRAGSPLGNQESVRQEISFSRQQPAARRAMTPT